MVQLQLKLLAGDAVTGISGETEIFFLLTGQQNVSLPLARGSAWLSFGIYCLANITW